MSRLLDSKGRRSGAVRWRLQSAGGPPGVEDGTSAAAVARDLDLTESRLLHQVARARAERTGGRTGLTTAERVGTESRVADGPRYPRKHRGLREHQAQGFLDLRRRGPGSRSRSGGGALLVSPGGSGAAQQRAGSAHALRDRRLPGIDSRVA
jgi:hypothetical protein